MSEKHGEADTDSANEVSFDPGDEKRLQRAFAALRMLVDPNNPLTLVQAIAIAHGRAEKFQRWQNSGALIRDVVIRLSDGVEYSTFDQLNFPTTQRRFGFTKVFPADAVLHIVKRADEQFGEVELLSVSLGSVRTGEFNREIKYKNGQTLQFNVLRRADGQFSIGVECTQPTEDRTMAASNRQHTWLGWLVPVSLAVEQLRDLLFKRHRKLRWLAPAVYASVLGVGCLFGYSFGIQLREDSKESTGAGLGLPGVPADTAEKGETFRDSERAHPITLRPPQTNPESRGAKTSQLHVDQGSAASTCEVLPPGKSQRNPNSDSTKGIKKPPVDRSQLTDKPKRSDSEIALGGAQRHSVANRINREITVYLQADASGDTVLAESLVAAFRKELQTFDGIVVVSGHHSGHDTSLISIRFAPKIDCHGIILVELYDTDGRLLWHDDRKCYDFPKGKLLEDASKELVAGLMPNLNSAAQQSGELGTQ